MIPEQRSTALKLHLVSLGCAKNRVDAEVMLGLVRQAGHHVVADPVQADVIVVNTCGFIDAAKEESVDSILQLAQHKANGTCRKLVVTGCLAQGFADQIVQNIPEVDQVLGSADWGRIVDAVADSATDDQASPPPGAAPPPRIWVSASPTALYDHDTPRVISGPRHSVFVKIAEGCDRRCAFCTIPRLRGRQRSRSVESLRVEVEQLVAQGAVEINLIAQDLTRYGTDLPAPRPTLPALLRELGTVEGLRWIRLHYAYPTAISDELVDTIAATPQVVPYVDVPLQHIDDELLRMMRRGHDSAQIHALLHRLRRGIDSLVLRTTFIVGHPGETPQSFEHLCEFVAQARFHHVGVFVYSAEDSTPSAVLPNPVPLEVAEQRREQLMSLQREISLQHNQALVGKRVEVLVDGASNESEFLLEGRYYGQAPDVDGTVFVTDGTAQPGDLIQARVIQATHYDLAASLDC